MISFLKQKKSKIKHCCSHSKDEKIEPRRDSVACPNVQLNKWHIWISDPRLLISDSLLFPLCDIASTPREIPPDRFYFLFFLPSKEIFLIRCCCKCCIAFWWKNASVILLSIYLYSIFAPFTAHNSISTRKYFHVAGYPWGWFKHLRIQLHGKFKFCTKSTICIAMYIESNDLFIWFFSYTDNIFPMLYNK